MFRHLAGTPAWLYVATGVLVGTGLPLLAANGAGTDVIGGAAFVLTGVLLGVWDDSLEGSA